MTGKPDSSNPTSTVVSLIRTLPASEAPAAQRAARDDFARRFAEVTCCPLPEEFARQWWPRADAG